MTERAVLPAQPSAAAGVEDDAPTPEIAAFIRFCHARRNAGWPELYDEMCAVAARREYNGWDSDQLAARGVTFSLFEMPRLAGWVRSVLAAQARPRDASQHGASTPRPRPQAVGA